MKHAIQRHPAVAFGAFACVAAVVVFFFWRDWSPAEFGAASLATTAPSIPVGATPPSNWAAAGVRHAEPAPELERAPTALLESAPTEAEARGAQPELDSSPCFDAILAGDLNVADVATWAGRFAADAEVDPESIEVDASTGNVKGALKAPNEQVAATFSIRGNRYEVELWPVANGEANGEASGELPLRSVRWGFADDLGAAVKPSLSLQHHPDTSGSVSGFVDSGAERVVGWTFSASDRGATAAPIVVRASREEPGAWIIGRAEATPSADWPGYFVDGSHKVLLGKLAPYAQK